MIKSRTIEVHCTWKLKTSGPHQLGFKPNNAQDKDTNPYNVSNTSIIFFLSKFIFKVELKKKKGIDS